jgi:hypothetical protein
MVWQDLTLMIGNFIIAGALLPTVLNKHKPAPLTSILDGAMLTMFAVVFVTLGLWLSAIAVSFSAALWFVLLAQVIKIRRDKDALHNPRGKGRPSPCS